MRKIFPDVSGHVLTHKHLSYLLAFVIVVLVSGLGYRLMQPSSAATNWKVVFTENWNNTANWGKYNNADRDGAQGPRIPENFTVQSDASGPYARIWTRKNTSNPNLPIGAWASGGGALQEHRYKEVKVDMKVRMSKAQGVRGAILLWPSNGSWSEEIDFYEIGADIPNRDRMKVSMHHPKTKFVEIYGLTSQGYPTGNHRISASYDTRDYSQWRDVQVILQEGLLQVSIDGNIVYKSTTDVPYYPTGGNFRDKSGARYDWNGAYYLGMQTAAPGRNGTISQGYMDVGRVTVSVPGIPTVDSTAPTVSLTAPVAGASFAAGSTVPLAANANDNIGVAKVDFYNGTTLLHSDTTAPYEHGWTLPVSAEAGSRSLTARAFDAAGNQVTSDARTISVTAVPPPPTADTTPPRVSVAINPATVIIGNPVNVTATATDNVRVTKVEFYLNTVLMATDTTAPYTASWTTYFGGGKDVTAKAFDAAGNVTTSPAENLTVVDVDTTAPAVSINVSPTSPAVGTNVNVSATATDAGGIAKVEFYLNTVLMATDTTAPYNASWQTSSTGNKNITARAYDEAGNVSVSAPQGISVSKATEHNGTSIFKAGISTSRFSGAKNSSTF